MIRNTKIYTSTDDIWTPIIEEDIAFSFTYGTYRSTKINNMKVLKKEALWAMTDS